MVARARVRIDSESFAHDPLFAVDAAHRTVKPQSNTANTIAWKIAS